MYKIISPGGEEAGLPRALAESPGGHGAPPEGDSSKR